MSYLAHFDTVRKSSLFPICTPLSVTSRHLLSEVATLHFEVQPTGIIFEYGIIKLLMG